MAFVAVAAMGLVLTSCNTTVEVAKRKHRKGYHVSISNNKSTASQVSETVSSTEAYVANVDSPAVDTAKHDHVAPSENGNTVAFVDSPSVDTAKHEHLIPSGLENTVAKIDSPAVDTVKSEKAFRSMNKMTLAQKFKAVKSVRKQLKQMKKQGFNAAGDDDWEVDSDVMFVLLFILALFIPPITVYLIKGKSNAFILNLILFAIGYIGLGIATIPNLVWLCALLAVVHAILVLLGHS